MNGITVNGTTTASATVTWEPVAGAVSYTVTRSMPAQPLCCEGSVAGLTTTTWTDPGPQMIGFALAGVYVFEVTAVLGDGTTVSGQANWTRPDPTCAAPPPGNLVVLEPLVAANQFVSHGPFPSGAVFTWANSQLRGAQARGVIAYRAERSAQGTNAWTLAATSCGGASPIVTAASSQPGLPIMLFADGLGKIVPNTTYLYRVTAFAANGETGTSTVAWTAPGPVVLRWLPGRASWAIRSRCSGGTSLPRPMRPTCPPGFT